jgi:rubrerythrin
MTLTALLERYAQFEKRGVGFYRGLAERFHASPAAARLWREMSNTEASHFALLELCQDWVAMAGGGASGPPITEAALDELGRRMTALEEAAQREGCTLAEAVALSIAWEELELPRILELVPHLPGQARGRVLAGMIAEAQEHYRVLMELARAAGAPGQAERAAALGEQCRAALG